MSRGRRGRAASALLVVALLVLGACGGDDEPTDRSTTTVGVPTTVDRSDLPVDDGVSAPEAGEWVTSSGDVCPYGLVSGGQVAEAGSAPSIFVPEGIDELRFSADCPFEPLDH